MAAALAPDGSLVRLRRKTDTTTLELQVGGSSDDSYENSGLNTPTATKPLADASDEYVGVRFQGVTIGQGVNILHAALSFVFSGDVEPADPKGTLYGDDADNAAAFGSGASDISNRTPTMATVAVDEADVLNHDLTFVELAEVTAIVQEIIDRGTWSSGNALALIFQADADGTRDFQVHHYDLDATHGAKLVITYETASPPAEAFISRVTSPSAASTFSSWTSLDNQISALGGVALAVDSDTLYAFMVDDDLTTIVVRTSTDNGATWSARSTVTAIGATKLSLAAAAAGDDDIVLFYAETDGTVYAVRWNGISWGTPAARTNTAHKITGLATTYLLDWQVVVTGSLVSGEHFVWACRYGDGVNQTIDTWGALKVITSAALNAGFVFAAPAAAFSSDFRVFFVESFSGDEAYDRVQWTTLELTHDFNEEQWRERVGFDFEDVEGVALVLGATTLWLVSAAGVWLSALPGHAEVDVLVELELDNADGSYTAYGSGTLGALQAEPVCS